MNLNLNLKLGVTIQKRQMSSQDGGGRQGGAYSSGRGLRGLLGRLDRDNLGNRQWHGLLLTKGTAIGRAVDLDTGADNHQVGGQLSAFVRLYINAFSILVERQLLQVAHPLTCQGRSVTGGLAEGRQGWGPSQG